MQIASSAFDEGETIPRRYTKDGADASPALQLKDVPEDAAALALIVDDPDAPSRTWVHWLIWNLPADRTAVSEGVPTDAEVSTLGGARQGTNDFGDVGYGGPKPPRGHGPHHYRFTVYALTDPLELEPGAHRDDMEAAMEGKVMEQARLTGIYERS